MVGLMNANEEGYESTEKDSIIEGPPDHNSLRPERPHNVSKRPARLLPLQLLFNRNCTTCSELPPRFYGPPTNCSDLTRLGYTLNGFYLVRASSNNDVTTTVETNEANTETVFCAFKQEGTFDASLVEKRIPPLLKSEVVSTPSSGGVVQLKLVRNENVINFRSQMQTRTSLKVSKIKFNRLMKNEGRGFDEKTGVFEAPKPGVYKFIFKGTLVVPQNLPFETGKVIVIIYLYHNDQEVGYAKYVNGDSTDLVIEETLKLNRGDKVDLRPVSQTGSLSILSSIQLDEGKSSFSGFLTHEFDD